MNSAKANNKTFINNLKLLEKERKKKIDYYYYYCLEENEVYEIEKQFGAAQPKIMVTGPNKQSSSNDMRLLMAIQTHLRHNPL